MTKLVSPAPYGWSDYGWGAWAGHKGRDYGWYNRDIAGSRQTFFAAPGKVVLVQDNAGYNQGFGNRIQVEHAPGFITAYNHYMNGTVGVFKVGQQVTAGQYIGQMGNTGETKGTIHLHFEVWRDGERVNPDPWFTTDIPGTQTLHPNDRVTGPLGANGRVEPTTAAAVDGVVGPGKPVRMAGFTRQGLGVEGNPVWYQGADGRWYWSGGFTSSNLAGLEDRTPPAPVEPEPTPEPTPEPVEPEPVQPDPEPVEPAEPEPATPVDPLPPFPEPTPPQPGEPDPPLQHAKPRPLYGWIGGIIAVIVGTIIALFGR